MARGQGLAWPRATETQTSVLAGTHLGRVHQSHQLPRDVQLGLVLFERHHCIGRWTRHAMSRPHPAAMCHILAATMRMQKTQGPPRSAAAHVHARII